MLSLINAHSAALSPESMGHWDSAHSSALQLSSTTKHLRTLEERYTCSTCSSWKSTIKPCRVSTHWKCSWTHVVQTESQLGRAHRACLSAQCHTATFVRGVKNPSRRWQPQRLKRARSHNRAWLSLLSTSLHPSSDIDMARMNYGQTAKAQSLQSSQSVRLRRDGDGNAYCQIWEDSGSQRRRRRDVRVSPCAP